MIDFDLNIEAEVQWYHCVFFLLSYFLTFIANRKKINMPLMEHNNDFGTYILYFTLVLLSIVAVTDGDFYHYAKVIQSGQDDGYLESIYYWLSGFVNYNYLLWRTAIWGSAIVLLYITFRRLQFNPLYAVLFLFFCYIDLYSYARAALAATIYFFGLTYIIKPQKIKILSFLIGAIIMWCSHYFHNSMYFLIALTPLILFPINKYTIWVGIVIVVLSASIVYQYFYDNIFSFLGSEDFADRFIYYTESEKSLVGQGISDILEAVLKYGTFFLPFVILSKRILMEGEKISTDVRLLYKMVVFIVIFSTALGVLTHTAYFFYRLLFMSIVPISALMAACYSKKIIIHKEFKLCIYWGIINILYVHLYMIYLDLL